MQNQQDRIAWIGLGLLGYELVPHLQKYIASQSLPDLAVWNRTAEKATALQSSTPGLQVASSIDELFSKYSANIIFTSLQNDAAVEQVYEQLISLASKAQHKIIFVETGTLYPGLSIKLEKEISSLPQSHIYLQCPVFGRPEAARIAQMVWVASGDPVGVERVMPYLDSMSLKVLDLKTTDVSAGSTLKLLGNFMLVSWTEIMSESVSLARKANLDAQHLVSFVDTFMPASPSLNYANRLVGGAEDPAGVEMTINVVSKDMTTLQRWGKELDAPAPTVDLLVKNYSLAKEKGFTQNWNFIVDTLNSTSENSSSEK
ncbi:hypothetical protein BGZ49_002400 [Haplosporangium sp. Z 27]|nr:hypothetical protein BGZ49_002400 [Haplosporangium sp. Z 27]